MYQKKFLYYKSINIVSGSFSKVNFHMKNVLQTN